jgi:hypothetical protein
MREWFLLLLALACFISFFSKSSNLHFLILTFASILLFLFALYSPLLLSLFFYLFIIFLLLSIFVDHFPSLFLVTTLLSTFLSLVLSPDWFPSHSFNGLFFSSTSTFHLCQHVLYMHSLTHWKPLVSVGKKTYCRSSFQTFNPFRVFHFPLNIPFVSRWSPPQIVRVNTFFDPKNKKLTL